MPGKKRGSNNNNNNANDGGAPRGGRGRGGRGGFRGRGRGGGFQAPHSMEDMMNSFVIPPPAPDSNNDSISGGRGRGRGRGRGGFRGRGGGGGFERGGRGRGGGFTPGRGRGGAAGVGGMGSSMLQEDLQIMEKMFNGQPQQQDYSDVLFPSTPRGGRGGRARGRGARGGARGGSTQPPVEPERETYRRPSGIGIGSPSNARGGYSAGNNGSYYRPVDPNGTLSSLLYRERPLLRPVVFVPGVLTKVLFSEPQEQEAEVVEIKVIEGPDGEDGIVAESLGAEDATEAKEYSAHAPTADRVMRVFSGALESFSSSSSSSSDEDEGDDDNEELEEIDFNDMSKLMDVDDTPATGVGKKVKAKTPGRSKLDTSFLSGMGGEEEETFKGVYLSTTSAAVSADAGESAPDVRVEETKLTEETTVSRAVVEGNGGEEKMDKEIVVAVEHMHVVDDEGVKTSAAVEVSSTSRKAVPVGDELAEDKPSDSIDVDAPAVPAATESEETIGFVIDTMPVPIGDTSPTAPSAAVVAPVAGGAGGTETEEATFGFVIDTDPAAAAAEEIAKPRIATPPPIRLPADDDDEVIVYVAPHPRKAEAKEEGVEVKTKEDSAAFTPYVSSRIGSVQDTALAGPSTPSQTMQTKKRLAEPPLSTPRMAKTMMVKQRKVAKRLQQRHHHHHHHHGRKSGGGGGLGAFGAMMQERELRDEFGFEKEDRRRGERRRGDSDVEWGTEDEDDGEVEVKGMNGKDGEEGEEEYMTYAELMRATSAATNDGVVATTEGEGVAVEGEENADGEGPFAPYTPSTASKRRQRRQKATASTAASFIASAALSPEQNATSRSRRRARRAEARRQSAVQDAMDMDVDEDLAEMDEEAMRRFVGGMLGREAGVHKSMGDVEDERRMREEDELGELMRGEGMSASEDESDDEDGEDEMEEMEKEVEREMEEMEKAVEADEEMMLAEDAMAELSVQDDEEEDDDDDDEGYEEEKTPRSNFQARLERLREQSLQSAQKAKSKAKDKGKGKARMDVDEDDDDEDDDDDDEFADDLYFIDEDDDEDDEDIYAFTKKKVPKWARAEEDEEDLIGVLQDLLDENQDILTSRGDRKKRNKLFNAISNGEFDYLDDDFTFQPAKRGKKAKRAGIPPELQAQWDKDRATKAARKQERELAKLLAASDPLSSHKGGKKGRKAMLAAAKLDPTITVLPNRVIDLSTLVQMLHKFVGDLGGKQSMSLPPTDKETRKNVHELAIAFGLKSVSKGKGDARYVTVVKTTRCGPGRVDERKVARIVRRSGGPGARGNDFTSGASGGRGGGGRVVVPKHKEGEVVGKAAPKIGATNVGFRMLAMMGWSEGERIGVGGLEAPIEAVIKHSKLGLGAMK